MAIDDQLIEANEEFILVLEMDDTAIAFDTGNATLTVMDDDCKFPPHHFAGPHLTTCWSRPHQLLAHSWF